MIDIESIIRNEINVPVSDDLSLYKSIETKKLQTPKIRKIVNDNVPKLDYAVNSKILKEINETGYSVVDNFLSENEVDYIANFISQFKGYNFHTPNRAYNTKPEFYNNDLDWNVCSYKMNHMLQNPFIFTKDYDQYERNVLLNTDYFVKYVLCMKKSMESMETV